MKLNLLNPESNPMSLCDAQQDMRNAYYGGAIGLIGLDGSFNHAIMIRTFISKNNHLHYRAGAGIVADSIAENELNEVNNKIAALRQAIAMAEEI